MKQFCSRNVLLEQNMYEPRACDHLQNKDKAIRTPNLCHIMHLASANQSPIAPDTTQLPYIPADTAMHRNEHPNITKEHLLDIRRAPTDKRIKGARRHSNAKPTPWQIKPVPRRYIRDQWHRVYQGRRTFIEAYDGSRVLVTADLEAFHAERSAVRPSEHRYLTRAEVQDIVADKADRDGVALGKVARRGMDAHRIPTRWRVWYAPHGGKAGNRHWHRVYATSEAAWLYIEVGGAHLRLVEHKQLLEGREAKERVRGAFGRIKIDRAAFLSWLRPDGEVVRETGD